MVPICFGVRARSVILTHYGLNPIKKHYRNWRIIILGLLRKLWVKKIVIHQGRCPLPFGLPHPRREATACKGSPRICYQGLLAAARLRSSLTALFIGIQCHCENTQPENLVIWFIFQMLILRESVLLPTDFFEEANFFSQLKPRDFEHALPNKVLLSACG